MAGITVQVNGVVQGVGFRPTVWKIANQLELTGTVWNGADGVTIELWGAEQQLQQFIEQLQQEPPPLAIIKALHTSPLQGTAPDQFTITESQDGTVTTAVAADAATCPACLEDIQDPENHRYHYPFTNCTHCGPRLSIIRAIPYDRPNTSMAPFTLCPSCDREYRDPADRRFHAQPNCCPVCGPQLWLEDQFGDRLENRQQQALEGDPVGQAAERLRQGDIVAIKGVGGIHLACDASNEVVVATLRQRKLRPSKALAVMVRTIEEVKRYAALSAEEVEALQSRAAPIVILDKRAEPLTSSLTSSLAPPLAPSIAPLQQSIGVMLPYSPLHHLLMEAVKRPIVLTSGNRSGQPQCIHNQNARDELSTIADYWLLHNREIINRVDDSVVRLMDGKMRTLRHARGYAPETLNLPDGFEESPELLAMGGELKNGFALLRGNQITPSQYIGDLKEPLVLQEYRHTHQLFQQLFDHTPSAIVVDQHPNYLPTQLGTQWATEKELPLVAVQHHHAHIAAVMVEHQLALDTPPLLGIALDGLGYGENGEIWGGEFLLCQYANFQRVGRFTPTAMPGGAKASLEPWRNSAAHLLASVGMEALHTEHQSLELVEYLQQKPLTTLQQMITKQLNCPLTSSCGRLIDAVAAALGICREQISFEGEAAIVLEALAEQAEERTHYPYQIEQHADLLQLEWSPLWHAILHDLHQDTAKAVIAARFHNSLIHAISTLAQQLCKAHQLERVVLGGGVFQNRILLEGISTALRNRGLEVRSAERTPANDQGIANGQCAIAAARTILGQ